jgi:hypothetical protein
MSATARAAVLGAALVLGAPGCTTAPPVGPGAAGAGATGGHALGGVWEGVVWEAPASFYQGWDRVRLVVADGGTWTGTVGAARAAGVLTVVRGQVVLDGAFASAHAPPATGGRLRYALVADGPDRLVLYGPTQTAFGGRTAAALVSLERAAPAGSSR